MTTATNDIKYFLKKITYLENSLELMRITQANKTHNKVVNEDIEERANDLEALISTYYDRVLRAIKSEKNVRLQILEAFTKEWEREYE